MRLLGSRVAARLALAWALACLGCSPSPEPHETAGSDGEAESAAGSELQVGDLPSVRQTGRLRFLSLPRVETYLPRRGSPLQLERDLATALAEDLGLEAVFVEVGALNDLIPALLEGRGDLIVGNFTVTEERNERVIFSAPIRVVREQLVTRAQDDALRRPRDLAGRRVAVRPSSSFWRSVKELEERVPALDVEPVPETLSTDDLLEGVANGRFDVTVADSNFVAAVLSWRDDLRVAFDLGEERIIAWAMRPDARELRRAVDRFLARAHHHQGQRETYAEGLPGVQRRKVLRVLTRNSATTYFIWRGQLLGFEYELARKFAEKLGVRIEIVVPPSRDDLLPWLKQGKGDLVAAGLTATAERAAREGVVFSRPYHAVRETLVARADDVAVQGPKDLDGRTLVVRRSSSYWQSLEQLRDQGRDFELVPAPEELETEAIIARVASGDYDLTLADSHIVDVELAWRDDIRDAFRLGETVVHGWALRPDEPELLAAVDEFIRSEYRGLFFNMTRNKYFREPRKIRRHVEFRAERQGQISPWDDLTRRYAARYGFDWRLILAQMHQESRFDPNARSFAGAQGLLQVLPSTARELGLTDMSDPETSVHAGVRYLAWNRERFERNLAPDDLNWFALAAYNVGIGHVRDARRIAQQRGWDRNLWFDNVERAMLLKERPEVHRKTRFGYARGSEPVAYVRAVRDRYRAYLGVAAPRVSAGPR